MMSTMNSVMTMVSVSRMTPRLMGTPRLLLGLTHLWVCLWCRVLSVLCLVLVPLMCRCLSLVPRVVLVRVCLWVIPLVCRRWSLLCLLLARGALLVTDVFCARFTGYGPAGRASGSQLSCLGRVSAVLG